MGGGLKGGDARRVLLEVLLDVGDWGLAVGGGEDGAPFQEVGGRCGLGGGRFGGVGGATFQGRGRGSSSDGGSGCHFAGGGGGMSGGVGQDGLCHAGGSG